MHSRGQIQGPRKLVSTDDRKELKVQIPRRLLLELQRHKIMGGERIATSVEQALRSYLRSMR